MLKNMILSTTAVLSAMVVYISIILLIYENTLTSILLIVCGTYLTLFILANGGDENES